jgi:alpha-glucosidase
MAQSEDANPKSGGESRPMLNRRNVLIGLGVGTAFMATGLGIWARRQWFDKHYAQPSFNSSEAVSYAAQSPNGLVRAEILFDAAGGGAPRWRVQHRGRAVLEPGSLGLMLADGRQLGPGVRIIGQQLTELDEISPPLYGVTAKYTDACNEQAVQMMDAATGIIFDILVRAYDAGVALRYLIRYIPDSETLQLSGENTHFKLPLQTRVYASGGEGENQVPAQLAPVAHPLALSGGASHLADLPVTAALPNGLTAVLTESDRLHYPQLMLRANDDADTLVTHLIMPAEESFTVTAPFTTPWRVVLVDEA